MQDIEPSVACGKLGYLDIGSVRVSIMVVFSIGWLHLSHSWVIFPPSVDIR
jgi:hypothetical protein